MQDDPVGILGFLFKIGMKIKKMDSDTKQEVKKNLGIRH